MNKPSRFSQGNRSSSPARQIPSQSDLHVGQPKILSGQNRQSLLQHTGPQQPLISNFFAGAGPPDFAENHPERDLQVDPDQVRIVGEGHHFDAKDLEGRRKVGELELYEDNDGNYWINNINVARWARGKGVASQLLAAAIEQHGTIYASTQSEAEDKRGDTRHLTPEGYGLVMKCIKRGMNIKYTFPVK